MVVFANWTSVLDNPLPVPNGDKEKQLIKSLLNQRDGLVEAAGEAAQLF